MPSFNIPLGIIPKYGIFPIRRPIPRSWHERGENSISRSGDTFLDFVEASNMYIYNMSKKNLFVFHPEH